MNTYLLSELDQEQQKQLARAKYPRYLAKGSKALVVSDTAPGIGTEVNCLPGNVIEVMVHWLNAPVATILDELHEKAQANPPSKGELKKALAAVTTRQESLRTAEAATEQALLAYRESLLGLATINGRSPFMIDGETYHLTSIRGGGLNIRRVTVTAEQVD